MAKYDAIIDVAESLVAQFGEESSLVRTVPGSPPDPAKPWEPGSPSVSSVTVSTVWLNRSILRTDRARVENDAYAILPAKDLGVTVPDPRTDHLTRADGTRYSILHVEPLDPNGQKIIYELTVKK